MDESDEILKVNYQLVYTVGKNTILAGGDLRWKLAQEVLCLAKKHFERLKEKFGNTCVEYNSNLNSDSPQAFTNIRLLNKEPYKKLCELIVEDILNRKSDKVRLCSFKREHLDCLKRYACDDIISQKDRNELKVLFEDDSHLKITMLCLRGFLAYEILFNVLSKRWRVNYGSNEKSFLLQAVPFRAKDVPAERAQFAHSDIAIMLTILNYYYTGLNMKQFSDVFRSLENDTEKDHIYAEWIKRLPKSCHIDDSIREYSGINLSDSSQMNSSLFPILHVYPPVINYWLNNFVFPKEAKQFPSKNLSSTSF